MKTTLLCRLGSVSLSLCLVAALLAPVAPAAPPAAPKAILSRLSTRTAPYPGPMITEAELPQTQVQADAGLPAAQLALGHYYMTHYEEGYVNEQKAGDWFRRAAESGDAEGQAWYAVWIWATDRFPIQGTEKARPWARKAAEQGSTLGEYLMGMFTPIEERERAMQWYRRAAKKGFMPAQRDLAFVLLWGNYFEDKKNPEVREAHQWIARASATGDPYALMMAGGHPHRSTMNTNEHKWVHPYKKSIKFVRQALTNAKHVEWTWYGSLFNVQEGYGRCHGKGGAHYMLVTQAAVDLYNLYSPAGQPVRQPGEDPKKAQAVLKELITFFMERAKTDPVAANLALAELFRHWKTLYFHHEPCPGDYKLFAAAAARATTPGGERYDDARLRQIAQGMVDEPRFTPHERKYRYEPRDCEACD